MKRSVEYKHEVISGVGRREIVAVLKAFRGKVYLMRGSEQIEMLRADARRLACELLDFVDSTTDADESPATFVERPET